MAARQRDEQRQSFNFRPLSSSPPSSACLRSLSIGILSLLAVLFFFSASLAFFPWLLPASVRNILLQPPAPGTSTGLAELIEALNRTQLSLQDELAELREETARCQQLLDDLRRETIELKNKTKLLEQGLGIPQIPQALPVLLLGGGPYNPPPERYSLPSNTWSKGVPQLINCLKGIGSSVLANLDILVTGGGRPGTTETQIYSAITRTWQAGPPMNVRRSYHSSTTLPNGDVLVVGGLIGGVGLDSVEIFSHATKTWRTVQALPEGQGRGGHVAVLLPSGNVLVGGGDDGSTVLASALEYSPSSDVWREVEPMQTARAYAAGCTLTDGTVLIVGGSDASRKVLDSAEVYNSKSEEWSFVASMRVPRHHHSATQMDGQAIIAGGATLADQPTDSVEAYSPDTNSWRSLKSLTAPRSAHSAVAYPNV